MGPDFPRGGEPAPDRTVATIDCVRDFRISLRLLLLLAALALASAAGRWQARAGPAAVAASGSAPAASALRADAGPRQPAFFGVGRSPRLTIGGRVQENGPPTGGHRPSLHPFQGSLLSVRSLAPTRLRAVERTRLAFAHHGATARSGARSSFGTSLPPPLLA